MIKRTLHIFLFSIFICLFSNSYAQTDIASWQGNISSWESGSEAISEINNVVPTVSFYDYDNNQINSCYLSYAQFNIELTATVPDNIVLPIKDIGITGMVTSDYLTWVEHLPIDEVRNLSPVTEIPQAQWFFDYGGVRDLDQRWQWIISKTTNTDSSAIYEVSYGIAQKKLDFKGDVNTEPCLYEIRGSDVINDVTLFPVWELDNHKGITLFQPSADGLDTLQFSEDIETISTAYSIKEYDNEKGSLYTLIRSDSHTYSLIHKVNGLTSNLLSFYSAEVPHSLITPFYQPSGSLDSDFIAWVANDGNSDKIHWARIAYSPSYDSQEIKHDSLSVEYPVTKLRANYMWDYYNNENFDSWYVTWSEYNVENNTTYLYSHMAARYPDNSTGLENSESSVPENFVIYPTYPNPFNASTNISFSLKESSFVRISISDILGREVELIRNEVFQSGNHKLNWNASNVATGTYFLMVKSGGNNNIQKISLIR